MPLDRPSRDEILDAVVTLLDRDVKPQLEGAIGYHLRVAISLLRLLRRELDASDAFEALEAEGLRELVPDVPEAERAKALASRIRAGEIAFDDARLVAHLRAVTIAKLAIDNPKYPSLADVRARGFAPED